MKGLFEAIIHCHALDIVHGDIKSENIMITEDNQVRLLDFGLSWQGSSQCDQMRGSIHYMAPEVLTYSYNKQADLWSLGVILYQLVSGHLPFQG